MANMSKSQAKEVVTDRQIAMEAARSFAAYFGDHISGPMVVLPPEQFNAATGAWEEQDLTKTLADYIQNAIARAKK